MVRIFTSWQCSSFMNLSWLHGFWKAKAWQPNCSGLHSCSSNFEGHVFPFKKCLYTCKLQLNQVVQINTCLVYWRQMPQVSAENYSGSQNKSPVIFCTNSFPNFSTIRRYAEKKTVLSAIALLSFQHSIICLRHLKSTNSLATILLLIHLW